MMLKIPSAWVAEFQFERDNETVSGAEAARTKLQKQLKRSTQIGAAELAEKLGSCSPTSPCASSACGSCNRAFRLRFCQQVAEVLGESEIVQVSLIPRSSRVERGALREFDLATWAGSRQRSFARALPPEARFLGGIDISFNEFENANPHWCFHLLGYMIMPKGAGMKLRRRRDRIRASIAKHCPPLPSEVDGMRQRPLLLRYLTFGEATAKASYLHKPIFPRRSSYMDTRRDTGNTFRNSADEPLRVRDHIELSLLLDRHPLGSRLILKGFRRHGGFGAFVLNPTS
ncbi:hypothetical protein NFO65_22440 [Neorhizobium galegae]|uniref:hypothetical protein n=1 Tax=Neorhizobium galegae TaxID=399 RepID=UPI0021012309|nr:hypothetical protein [Neorhizobium galegae]MCQ1573489.1 hypothetical protein [Neorhizobium galegae]